MSEPDGAKRSCEVEEEELIDGLYVKGFRVRAPCITSDCSDLGISVEGLAEDTGIVILDATAGLTDVKFLLSLADARQLRDALDLVCDYLEDAGCDVDEEE